MVVDVAVEIAAVDATAIVMEGIIAETVVTTKKKVLPLDKTSTLTLLSKGAAFIIRMILLRIGDVFPPQRLVITCR